jgi:hypothetical protein
MDEFNPVDNLISDILSTTGFIGKIMFSRNSILVAAAISFLFVVLFWIM